jgi:hypothetical protein
MPTVNCITLAGIFAPTVLTLAGVCGLRTNLRGVIDHEKRVAGEMEQVFFP